MQQIAYRYTHEPPMSATKVLAISGLSALGELPGVINVDVHKEVGDSLDWRNGPLDKIFQVTGAVTSYEELARHHELLVRDSYVSYEHDMSQLAELPQQVPT